MKLRPVRYTVQERVATDHMVKLYMLRSALAAFITLEWGAAKLILRDLIGGIRYQLTGKHL